MKILPAIALCLLSSTAYATTTHVQPGANIQAISNAAAVGDTVFFDPGTYNVSGITLKSGVTYHGGIGTAILHSGSAAQIFNINATASANITIDGFTFDGGYLDLEAAGANAGQADNITVTNNTFQNLNINSVQSAIFYTYLKNSKIDHNAFKNISMAGGTGSAINGYHADNLRITYNLFNGVHEAISANWENIANTGRNIYTGYNVGTGVERMGIEYLTAIGNAIGPTNMIVEYNWFSNWATTHNDGNRFAYSIVPNSGTGVIVRNNYGDCGTGVSLNGHCDIGVELAAKAGTNTGSATSNDIRGFSGAVWVYWPGWSVTNNNFSNDGCLGNACVNIYTSQGVNSSNTVISGNLTPTTTPPVPTPPAAGPGAAAPPPPPPPPPPGHVAVPIDASYKLVFDDEFNGASIDTSKWSILTSDPSGGWSTTSFVPANASETGGFLNLAVTQGSPTGRTYSGAFVFTKQSWSTGYWEARAKMPPNGHGIWPAFWMNNSGVFPEIDIFEWLGNGPTIQNQAYHPVDDATLTGGVGFSQQITGPDFSAAYHVYGMWWTPGTITWYVDGIQTFQLTQGQMFNGHAVNITATAMSTIINNAVGGWNNNVVDSSTIFPSTMAIDYVHVFSNSTGAVAITPQPGYGGPGDAVGSSAPPPPPPPVVNGACGAAANVCTTGTPAVVWDCLGANGGTTATCVH